MINLPKISCLFIMRYSKKNIFAFLLILIAAQALFAGDYIVNSEMNAPFTDKRVEPFDWYRCDEETTADIYVDYNGMTADGQFLFLRTRGDSLYYQGNHPSPSSEGLYAKLKKPLEKGYCYTLDIDLGFDYSTRVNYPPTFQLWMATDTGQKAKMIFESLAMEDVGFKHFTFNFQITDQDWEYIYITPGCDTLTYPPPLYNSELCIDNIFITQRNEINNTEYDTVYFSYDPIIQLHANPGFFYRWDNDEVLSNARTQHPYLYKYNSDIEVVVEDLYSCPSNQKFHVKYICDSVYKNKLRKEEVVYLNINTPLVLRSNERDDYFHSWTPRYNLSAYDVANPEFIGFEDIVKDTIVYTDVVTVPGSQDCQFFEKHTVIKDCQKIHSTRQYNEETVVYNYMKEPIEMAATEAKSYLWEPDINLSSDTIMNPVFKGYDELFNPEMNYTVSILDKYNCAFQETFQVVRDCNLLYPINDSTGTASVLMLDTLIESKTMLQFQTNGTPVGKWMPSTYFLDCDDCANPAVIPLSKQQYVVEVIDDLECLHTEIFNVDIKLKIPNVFTPNDDEYNNEFVTVGIPPESEMNIYEKSGRLVFTSTDYLDDWWDGTDLNGNKLETGTYWYALQFPNDADLITGFIFLRR